MRYYRVTDESEAVLLTDNKHYYWLFFYFLNNGVHVQEMTNLYVRLYEDVFLNA